MQNINNLLERSQFERSFENVVENAVEQSATQNYGQKFLNLARSKHKIT